MAQSQRRGRVKAPNIPIVSPHNSEFASSSSNAHDIARVFNTMEDILAASNDIIQRDAKQGTSSCSSLPTATLDRLSALTASLWENIRLLPGSSTPPLQKTLTVYELILVDVQQALSSKHPLEISHDTIDHRLDDFLLQFQEALDRVEDIISQRSSVSNPTSFFENSRHISIKGGNFTGSATSYPVVHDPVVREQSRKILQMVYIQCGVLFS